MRSKRWPAALGAAAGLVMIVAGTAGLLASCSSQQPRQPARGQDTVPTPATSIVTGAASASSPPSVSPSPAGPGQGAVRASYATPGGPAQASSVALPVSLTIPVIGVRAPLLKLGLVTQSSLACPADPSYDILHKGALNSCPLDADPAAAGWYTGSSPPGAVGPAIIAGHINFNGPAVFGRLKELRAGDYIYVTQADGDVVTFRVTKVQSTLKSAFPAGGVYGQTPDEELDLITCGGDFDDTPGTPEYRHYYSNTIVYSTEVT
jgi:LPXTG-site transpeptidase (sortase) family protein